MNSATLEQWHLLAAVVDHGGFAQAAEHLHKSQSTVSHGVKQLQAALPTAEEAALLGIAPRDPCLVVVRRTFTRDAAITIARLVQPGARYTLHGEFAP